jgi:hypothetical protein
MAGGEIVPRLFLWVLKIRVCGQVDDGRPITDDEGLVREMSLQDAKEIIKPVSQKLEYIRIGRRCKSPLETVRCRVAR